MKKKDEYWHKVKEQLKKEWCNDNNFYCLSELEIQMIINEYVDTNLNELNFDKE